MIKTKDEFIRMYEETASYLYGRPVSGCNDEERYTALVSMIRDMAMKIRRHPQ